MKIVDARGLACPQPLIKTKQMIDSLSETTDIEVIVDNDIAVGNVVEYLKQLGFTPTQNGFKICFTAEAESSTEGVSAMVCPTDKGDKWAVAISSLSMGKGSDELGAILLKAFINTLAQGTNIPSHIVMYNEGVKCAMSGSGVLEALKSLEDKGVTIIVCGTCVEYFDIKDQIEVGIISNMLKIIETKQSVSKVVYP